jgi:hypothetical protein
MTLSSPKENQRSIRTQRPTEAEKGRALLRQDILIHCPFPPHLNKICRPFSTSVFYSTRLDWTPYKFRNVLLIFQIQKWDSNRNESLYYEFSKPQNFP